MTFQSLGISNRQKDHNDVMQFFIMDRLIHALSLKKMVSTRG